MRKKKAEATPVIERPNPEVAGGEKGEEQAPKKEPLQKEKESWPSFVYNKEVSEKDIKDRISTEILEILRQHTDTLSGYVVLYLYDTEITPYASDQIYTALSRQNQKRERSVLLLIESYGGRIEPAYQISKLCADLSKDKFVVVVPRYAKSSATLVSLGAHEIHMGLLSELGPIDPQLEGRSVLGLSYSLERIAKICEQYPKSSEMFANYLSKSLYVPNIGYYERIGESAVQYAERLISNKAALKPKANALAKLLVYEYKDHGFVIDVGEARMILGNELIKTETKELAFGEAVHQKVDFVDFLLRYVKKKRLQIVGDLEEGILISDVRT